MTEKRTLECKKCGNMQDSAAMPKNVAAGKVKCKQCAGTSFIDTLPVAEPEIKTCPRCKGDGFWHSNRTGVRALTSSEPLVDELRPCPECNGEV